MNRQAPPPAPKAEMLDRLGLKQEPRTSISRRVGIFAVAALLGLGIAAWFLLSGEDAGDFETAEIVRRDLVFNVSATGTLEPENQVDVGPEISGRVDRVLVDFNDRIMEGDVLAELDTEQLDARLAQSQAALNAARAGVAQSVATLEQARATSARAQALFERMVVSEQDMENARADLQRAEANLQRARADAELASAQVDADRTALSKAVIRSPITGVVLDRQVEPGQTVAASFQTPVMFTLASDLSRMELIVDIDEADIGTVREGQKATFTVDAFPQRSFDAELISVHNAPNIENGVVTYKGVMTVDNSSGLLRPGLTANADITVAALTDTLFVPNGALRFTPIDAVADSRPPASPGADATGRVWLLENGVPVPRDLSLGRSNGQLTEVLSGDVAAGEDVIVDVGNPAER